MDRCYVICHMTTSIDGKVTGNHLSDARAAKAEEAYYEIHRNFKADAFACGRVTMEGSFTEGRYPDLSKYPSVDDRSDFIGGKGNFYAVAYDRKGRLGWKDNIIHDDDPGYDNAVVIEVLSEDVDNRYLGYLQAKNISYIFAGKKDPDIPLSLKKLYESFGIKTLLLEGGSILNGAFLKAGMVDELSLVQIFLIADKEGMMLFNDADVEGFDLMETDHREGFLYLRYRHI